MWGTPPIEEINPEWVRIAAHELGHAVVMRELGYTPTLIRVRHFLGGGFCTSDEPVITPENWRDYGIILVAGFEGENLWCTRTGRPELAYRPGAASDEAEFKLALRRVKCFDEVELIEQQARVEARRIIAECEAEIDDLLPDLAYSGTLRTLDPR